MDSLLIRKQLWFFYWAAFRNTTSMSMATGDGLQETEQKQKFNYKQVSVERNTDFLFTFPHQRVWLPLMARLEQVTLGPKVTWKVAVLGNQLEQS